MNYRLLCELLLILFTLAPLATASFGRWSSSGYLASLAPGPEQAALLIVNSGNIWLGTTTALYYTQESPHPQIQPYRTLIASEQRLRITSAGILGPRGDIFFHVRRGIETRFNELWCANTTHAWFVSAAAEVFDYQQSLGYYNGSVYFTGISVPQTSNSFSLMRTDGYTTKALRSFVPMTTALQGGHNIGYFTEHPINGNLYFTVAERDNGARMWAALANDTVYLVDPTRSTTLYWPVELAAFAPCGCVVFVSLNTTSSTTLVQVFKMDSNEVSTTALSGQFMSGESGNLVKGSVQLRATETGFIYTAVKPDVAVNSRTPPFKLTGAIARWSGTAFSSSLFNGVDISRPFAPVFASKTHAFLLFERYLLGNATISTFNQSIGAGGGEDLDLGTRVQFYDSPMGQAYYSGGFGAIPAAVTSDTHLTFPANLNGKYAIFSCTVDASTALKCKNQTLDFDFPAFNPVDVLPSMGAVSPDTSSIFWSGIYHMVYVNTTTDVISPVSERHLRFRASQQESRTLLAPPSEYPSQMNPSGNFFLLSTTQSQYSKSLTPTKASLDLSLSQTSGAIDISALPSQSSWSLPTGDFPLSSGKSNFFHCSKSGCIFSLDNNDTVISPPSASWHILDNAANFQKLPLLVPEVPWMLNDPTYPEIFTILARNESSSALDGFMVNVTDGSVSSLGLNPYFETFAVLGDKKTTPLITSKGSVFTIAIPGHSDSVSLIYRKSLYSPFNEVVNASVTIRWGGVIEFDDLIWVLAKSEIANFNGSSTDLVPATWEIFPDSTGWDASLDNSTARFEHAFIAPVANSLFALSVNGTVMRIAESRTTLSISILPPTFPDASLMSWQFSTVRASRTYVGQDELLFTARNATNAKFFSLALLIDGNSIWDTPYEFFTSATIAPNKPPLEVTVLPSTPAKDGWSIIRLFNALMVYDSLVPVIAHSISTQPDSGATFAPWIFDFINYPVLSINTSISGSKNKTRTLIWTEVTNAINRVPVRRTVALQIYECTVNLDCPTGFECKQQLICVSAVGCNYDFQCSSGFVCRSSACVPRYDPPPLPSEVPFFFYPEWLSPISPPVSAPISPPASAPISPPTTAPSSVAQPIQAPLAVPPPINPPIASPLNYLGDSPVIPCLGNSPVPGAVCDFSTGIWIITSTTLVIAPADEKGNTTLLDLSSSARIHGDLIISSTLRNVTVRLAPGARLYIDGCASFSGTLEVSLTAEEIAQRSGTINAIQFSNGICGTRFDNVTTLGPIGSCDSLNSSPEYRTTSITVIFQVTSLSNTCGGAAQSNAAAVGAGVGIPVAIVAILIVGFIVYRKFIKRPDDIDTELGEVLDDPQPASSKSNITNAEKESITSLANGMLMIPSSDVRLLHKLGAGSYGEVYLASLPDGEFVAVKQLLSGVIAKRVEEFFSEAALMLTLPKHANVVAMHGVIADGDHYGICMEFCPQGSLDKLLEKKRASHVDGSKMDSAENSRRILIGSEELLFNMLFGVVSAMELLASRGIVHRDLAARNILLDDHFFPKISDFGFSRKVGGEDQVGRTESRIGPIRWMSPENLRDRIYSEKSDIWSFGCFIVELLTGALPYDSFQGSLPELAVQIRDDVLNPLSDLKCAMREHNFSCPKWLLKEILPLCFLPDPESRPTFSELAEKIKSCAPSLYVSYGNELDQLDAIVIDPTVPAVHDDDDHGNAACAASPTLKSDSITNYAPIKIDDDGNNSISSTVKTQKTKKKQNQPRRPPTTMRGKQWLDPSFDLSSKVHVLSQLGEGSFGVVFLGLVDNRYVAIKRLATVAATAAAPAPAGSNNNNMLVEAAIMTKLRPHRNIISMLGVVFDENSNDGIATSSMSIVMEFAPRGSLDSFLARNFAKIKESSSLTFRFIIGIARGMEALAEQKVVHRDLAARNVLLDSSLEPKLSDFGLARIFQEDSGKTESRIGPIRWMAPECFAEGVFSEKTDVWSFGCVIIEILTGAVPYGKEMDVVDIYSQVRDGKLNPITYLQRQQQQQHGPDRDDVLEMAPEYLRILLAMCFEFKSSKRPTFSKIISFLLENVPAAVIKAEKRREKRRIKREKILQAIDELVV